MSFEITKTIKKPRKTYSCRFCDKPIAGKHLYVSGKQDDFYYYRTHHHCQGEMDEICSQCDYSFDCQMDAAECFNENKKEVVL